MLPLSERGIVKDKAKIFDELSKYGDELKTRATVSYLTHHKIAVKRYDDIDEYALFFCCWCRETERIKKLGEQGVNLKVKIKPKKE